MIILSIRRTFSNLTIFRFVIQPVPTQINARFRHRLLDKGVIESRLGLPTKPKRPNGPFFQYMMEVRESIMKENPMTSQKKIVEIISKKWRSLDEEQKEKYSMNYRNDVIAYKEQMAQFNEITAEEDRQLIKETRIEVLKEHKKRGFIRLQRKKAKEVFGRPRKPMSGYLNFVISPCDRQPNEKHPDYLRRKSSEWKNLSKSEKEKYAPTAEAMQKYKDDYLRWKGQMMKAGKYDVLNTELPQYVKFDSLFKVK